MSNFSYLSTRPEYSLFANSAIEAETRRKIIDIDLKAMGWKFTGADADVRGGVPEGVGAGGEVGVCGRQNHHDAL